MLVARYRHFNPGQSAQYQNLEQVLKKKHYRKHYMSLSRECMKRFRSGRSWFSCLSCLQWKQWRVTNYCSTLIPFGSLQFYTRVSVKLKTELSNAGKKQSWGNAYFPHEMCITWSSWRPGHHFWQWSIPGASQEGIKILWQ